MIHENEFIKDEDRMTSYYDCLYLFDKTTAAGYENQNGLWNKTSFKMQLYKYDCSKEKTPNAIPSFQIRLIFKYFDWNNSEV